MTQAIRKHPILSIAIAIALALGISIAWPLLVSRPAGADTPGPAVVHTAAPYPVTINAPQSGGNVYVSGYVGGSGAQMYVYGRSVTRDNLLNGGTPNWIFLSYTVGSYGSPGSFYGNIQAGYGDLLEVKATNYYGGYNHTDIKQVGYVPAGYDTAPPDFNVANIAASYVGTTFTLTFNNSSGITDPSYPITVTLTEYETPTTKSVPPLILTISTTYPKTLSVSNIESSHKVRVDARDNYGNDRSMLYVMAQLGLASANNTFTAEPNQAPAERTGNQAVGAMGVQLHNGSFVHGEEFFEI